METLEYKLANDTYFKDVQLNPFAISTFPIHLTDVSPLLYHVTSFASHNLAQCLFDVDNPDLPHLSLTDLHPSSFISTLPNSHIKVDEKCTYLQSSHSNPMCSLLWLTIGLSPINEYTNEGLLSMAFPTY